MFASNSRYYGLPTYTVPLPNGRIVAVIRCALPSPLLPAGYYRRVTGDRLDLLAARYLNDATVFWKLCDANNAPAPDALAAMDLIGIPEKWPIDMSTTFDIIVGGTPASDFDTEIIELEVEENADLPGAISLTLPVSLNDDGDYDTVSDPRLAPLSNVAVIATAADNQQQCLFDGFVLAQQVHLDTGTATSTMKAWGQDASWLMNVRELAKEWVDVTDGTVANTIFGNYNFAPHPDNLADDGPIHAEDGATLMQRASDAQFLRALARRNGKLFRVFCADTPGVRTGYFAVPDLRAAPSVSLYLNDDTQSNVSTLDFSFDIMRPTTVSAFQALFTNSSGDTSGAGADVTDDGLPVMDQRGLADVATADGAVTTLLTTTAADSETLTQRANALLREAGWFVRCSGTTDADLLGTIMRVGTIVAVNSVGTLFSGNYLVWSVRHRITAEKHEMSFVLVRNALGSATSNGGPNQ